jgi:hypothetical protein
MKVWKVITDITLDQYNSFGEIFSPEDASMLLALGDEYEIFNWDFVENETVIPFIICPKVLMDLMSCVVEKYNIKFKPVDITEDFLMGLHDVPDPDFTMFREDNLTEDIVYEKIKKFGGSSLDDVDKYILENS